MVFPFKQCSKKLLLVWETSWELLVLLAWAWISTLLRGERTVLNLLPPPPLRLYLLMSITGRVSPSCATNNCGDKNNGTI